jgi:1-acyl-sn-glycerol-3-phosphate acyltransferase
MFSVFLALRGVEALARRGRSGLSGWAVRVWAGVALWTLGLRYVQHGRPMPSAGAFVANHSSWIDIIVLQRAAAPFLVSKSEVRDWPVIGQIARAIGTLFVERRSAAAKQQERDLIDRLADGHRMAIFPEGTSTDGLRVLPFKTTLFAVFFSDGLSGEVAAQPVAIVYTPSPGLPASFYGWWGAMDFATHLRTVLARSRGGMVETSFLEPVPVAGLESRKQMAEICGRRVAEEFAALRAAKG